MSDATEQEQKRPLTLARTGPRLELRKGVETGQVRQSFSHGRSKTVTVEVRKKRMIGPGAPGGRREAEAAPAAPAARPHPAEPTRRPVVIPRALTAEERAGRVRAVQDAHKADEEARRRAALVEADRRREEEERAAEEARRRAEEEVRAKTEEEEARRRAAEDARKRSEEEAQRRKEEESRREVAERAGKAAAAKVAALAAAGKVAMPAEEEEEPVGAARRGARPEIRKPAPAPRHEVRRRTGKLTVTRALSGDEGERMRSLASVRRARERERQRLHQGEQEPVKIVREVVIPETITVQELANRMAERGVDVIKALMRMGVMATINQVIDADTAELVVTEFGHRLRRVSEVGCRDRLARRGRRRGDAAIARPGGHRDGPCRPRQDLAARRAARDRCRGRRSRRHHPAYRRLSGQPEERPADHLYRHAGPSGLYRDARPRRQRHRHRRAGGRRR